MKSNAGGEYGFSLGQVAKLKPSMIITMLSVLQIQKYGKLAARQDRKSR
jgi:hypothetical protein